MLDFVFSVAGMYMAVVVSDHELTPLLAEATAYRGSHCSSYRVRATCCSHLATVRLRVLLGWLDRESGESMETSLRGRVKDDVASIGDSPCPPEPSGWWAPALEKLTSGIADG